ncbi:MAG: hypothetical protein HY816_11620 [Candidatus Wallbacteria bacterium]|nr:hypothetical protein [Candidatus Wallbacteria bacterium]
MLDLGICATKLEVAGIPHGIDRAEAIDPGKVAIRLANGGGFVKLALHPYAATLLQREVTAYAAAAPCPPFRRPALLGCHDGGDWGALWLTLEEGRVPARRSALVPRSGPYESVPTTLLPVEAILAHPLPPRFEAHRLRLLERFAGEPIRCGPIHGDFVYWNLLTDNGRPTLVDYEHFEKCAPASHDRFQWTVLPLLRRASAWGRATSSLAALAAAPLAYGLAPPKTAWPVLELALFLIRFGARIEAERTSPIVAELYAFPTRRGQERLVKLIDHVLGGLLG